MLESEASEEFDMMKRIDDMVGPTKLAGTSLEMAGAGILQRASVDVVGKHLVDCGEALGSLSAKVGALDASSSEGKLSAQRMMYASQQMIVAGRELRGEKKEKPKGKGWIKG